MANPLQDSAGSPQGSSITIQPLSQATPVVAVTSTGATVAPATARKKLISESSDGGGVTPRADTAGQGFTYPPSITVTDEIDRQMKTPEPGSREETLEPDELTEEEPKRKPEAAKTKIGHFKDTYVLGLLKDSFTDKALQAKERMAQTFSEIADKLSSATTRFKDLPKGSGGDVRATLKRQTSKEAKQILAVVEDTSHTKTNLLKDTPPSVSSAVTHDTEEDLQDSLEGYRTHLAVYQLRDILREQRVPLTELPSIGGPDGASYEDGEFCISVNYDLFRDKKSKDKELTPEQVTQLIHCPTIANLIAKQLGTISSASDQHYFLALLRESGITLQIQVDKDAFLPVYTSSEHKFLEETDDSEGAPAWIERCVEGVSPGAIKVIWALSNPLLFNELESNLKQVTGILPVESESEATGYETKLTFVSEEELRMDCTKTYDKYQKTGNTKEKDGFITLKLSVGVVKRGELWVPQRCYFTYDVATGWLSRKEAKRKSSVHSSDSGSPMSSRLSVMGSDNLSSSLSRLSGSMATGLDDIGDDSKSPSLGQPVYLRTHSDSGKRRLSVSPALSQTDSDDSGPTGHSRQNSEPADLSVAAPAIQPGGQLQSSSQASITSTTSSTDSPLTSLSSQSVEPVAVTQAGETMGAFLLGGTWYISNCAPVEAAYKLYLAREINAWKGPINNRLDPSKQAELISRLRQLNIKAPSPSYFAGTVSAMLHNIKHLPAAADRETLDLAPEIHQQLQESYTEQWQATFEQVRKELDEYDADTDKAMPKETLTPDQHKAIQTFLTEVQKTKQEFMAVLEDLETRLQTTNVSNYEEYKALVTAIAEAKTKCNLLNSRARTRTSKTVVKDGKLVTESVPTMFEQLKLDTEVHLNSPMSRYMDFRQRELNAVNMLCSVKFDLLLRSIEVKDAETDPALQQLVEKQFSTVLNTQSKTLEEVGLHPEFIKYEETRTQREEAAQIELRSMNYEQARTELTDVFSSDLGLTYDDLSFLEELVGINLTKVVPFNQENQVTNQKALLDSLLTYISGEGLISENIQRAVDFLRKPVIARAAERKATS